LPIGSSSSFVLNQWTQLSVACSIAFRLCHGPCLQITSAFYNPLMVSAMALP
jgi:hypothetical protein